MRLSSGRPWPVAAALSISVLCALSPAAAVTGGNDFYSVRIEGDPSGFGLGLYTIGTGPFHPVTGSLGPMDILFGGTLGPGQSFTTIRSFSSGVDYVQNNGVQLLPGAPVTVVLEDFVVAGEAAIALGDPNAPSGFRTVYRVGDAAPAADSLFVVQEVEALGASFNDSAVRIETSITNTGTAMVEIGVRYLWDFRIGFDDGPTYREINPDGAVETLETSRLSPAFETYEITDNNKASMCFSSVNPAVPFFAVQGSVTGPAVLAPTPPSRIDFASWPAVSGLPGLASAVVPQQSAFDYVNGGADATTCDISLDDTAMIYWWGDDQASALAIAPGATVTLAAYIFGYLPGTPPAFPPPPEDEGPFGDPTCSDGVDNDGDGLIDSDDPDCMPPPGDEGPWDDPTCSDGIDNDQDGLTDGDDPDCAPPNGPPDCSAAAASVEELWPPNHRMRQVRVEGVTDPEGDPVTITVMGIYQDEPLNGKGDGNTCPDAGGVGGDRVLLRSERTGLRDGRVYHIFFDATDTAGGRCSGAVSVCVPHDQSKKKEQCVDQGPIFDATGACGIGAESCLSRGPDFYGTHIEGAKLLEENASSSLGLHPKNPLRAIYPGGSLLPLTLGGGAFEFEDARSIVGTQRQGSGDGGFLPSGESGRGLVLNALPAGTLTLSLNTGLSLLGADSGAVMDLDDDGVAEALRFSTSFPGLVVDRPGNLGDYMSVEDVLEMANGALAAGAGAAGTGDRLEAFVSGPLPPVFIKGNGKKKGKGSKYPTVGDLIDLVEAINSACDLPRSNPTGALKSP